MRPWALSILRCLACGATGLEMRSESLHCLSCGTGFPITSDVTNFLTEINPVVARELSAVSSLDKGLDEIVVRLRHLLKQLDSDSLAERDFVDFPCLRHAIQSRSQIHEILDNSPLLPGQTILELGADHCWASSLFLDFGCRVLAVDITDHLLLASRADHPMLCRIFADMNHLPVSDGSVDIVWTTAAAHHSWDLQQTLHEAARVLRPGGRLIFCCEPMPSWLRYPFGFGFGREQRKLGINEKWIPRRTWLRLCSRAGLQPWLMFPSLSDEAIQERLKRHHLPVVLAPLAKTFLKSLQVSIHLLAKKPSWVQKPE